MVRGVQAEAMTGLSCVSSSLVRVAMWSGPRNISTAMMRAWENRPDRLVVDEPLQAHCLSATGKQHPMTRRLPELFIEWTSVEGTRVVD